MAVDNIEIECRFVEIDKEALINKLRAIGAEDKGELLLEETIVYDKDLAWSKGDKWVKIRRAGEKTFLTYKEKTSDAIDGVTEVEMEISDANKAELFLEKIGMRPHRKQQKLRHTFILKDVRLDIDTWPKIPTYVEFEGPSEEAIRKAVNAVGYSWDDATYDRPAKIIETKYGIAVRQLRYFTFDRVE